MKRWIDFILDMDRDAEIVLFGRSMGGATVMFAMCYCPEHIRCVIEDCGYGSVYDQFRDYMHENFHIPEIPFMKIASLICRMRAGYSLEEASIKEELKGNKVPCLFIHGDRDRFVPFRFERELYDLDGGEKDILVVKDAGHSFSEAVAPEVYRQKVDEFLDRYISA